MSHTAEAVAPSRPSRPVVVASVPAGHVYVRHLAPETHDGPTRLPDPRPPGVLAPSTRWWPPVMLDPAWVTDQAAAFDVFHLHFGFDALTPRELQDVVDAVRAQGTPFVYTVHDLRNPHHADRAAHDAQLDVLVPAADALITLTPGAAAEIQARWGRVAEVVAHPHVVPFGTMQRVRAEREVRRRDHGGTFRVGLHLKSLRASMAPGVVLPTLVEAVADLPGAVLQVNAHRDAIEPGGPRFDADLASQVTDLATAGRLDLRVHDYLSDDDLHAYLGSLDVSVLPYRFGTHSGWLEACRDLGTTVVAPTCGYFAEQGPVLGYVQDETRFDAATLADAVRRAYVERAELGTTVSERRAQRRQVAHAHDAVYRSVLAGGRVA